MVDSISSSPPPADLLGVSPSDGLEFSEIAAAPVLAPAAAAATAPVIGAAVLAGLGIGWASLSPADQARVVGAVGGFVRDHLDPAQAGELVWDIAGNAFRDVSGALERTLSEGQRAELDEAVRGALPEDGRGRDTRPDPEPKAVPTLPRSEEDDRSDPRVAFRVSIQPQAEGDVQAGSAYIEVPDEPGEAPRNIVVNRLVQRVEGHDDIHLLTGLGLNGIGADRIGAAFPATGIEVETLGLGAPAEAQRNVNGLYIELLNDGFYEAMVENDRVDFQGSVDGLPDHLTMWGRLTVEEFAATTGSNANNPVIELGTDYARHVDQAASSGIVQLVADLKDPSRTRPDLEPKYLTMVKDRFAALLDGDPALREVLNANLQQLVEYSAGSYHRTMNRDAPPAAPAEIILPPEQMEAILRTSIAALDDVIAAVGEKKPGHVPEGLIELRNFYRSILDEGTDGTPALAWGGADPVT